jgi:hypothetical protein
MKDFVETDVRGNFLYDWSQLFMKKELLEWQQKPPPLSSPIEIASLELS